jgi:DNA topoisomerase I
MAEAMIALTDKIRIPRASIRHLHRDHEKSAAAARLVYVNDAQPGIRRLKRGKGFVYLMGGRKVSDAEVQRIRKLVIPPAWENVWICRLHNGHIQATGLDVRKRKQYKYHTLWHSLRSHTKFHRLHDFGRALPAIRQKLQDDLKLPGMSLNKVLAAVVSVLEATSIRVGNNMYEKLYGSFGLTTLKDKHVNISGSELRFFFTGKKGIPHRISIKSRRLAAIVKQCRDIPGKELFQYIAADGSRKQIDSGMVNDYIRNISGGDFTAKDFRTWAGTAHAIRCFAAVIDPCTPGEKKKRVVAVLDQVAALLGNTRTVCRKYYVHPLIISLFENDRLHKYVCNAAIEQFEPGQQGLNAVEQLLMGILQKEKIAA